MSIIDSHYECAYLADRIGVETWQLLYIMVLQEGIALLKAAGKDTLLEMQGLKDPEPEKPAVNRETTMEATAKVRSPLLTVSDYQ